MSSLLQNRKLGNRLILWFIFSIQLILIVIFLLFSGFTNEFNQDVIDGASVKFLGKKKSNDFNRKLQGGIILPKLANFTEHFHEIKVQGDENGVIVNNVVYCFREGTTTYRIQQTEDFQNETKCVCRPEWHGDDCGQPEVLWRSFMTSKFPIHISQPRNIPHRIYYFIQTNGINIETLEIQMMELIDIVDLYILCDRKDLGNRESSESLKIRLNTTGLLKNYKDRIIILEAKNFGPKIKYKKFKKILQDATQTNVNLDDVIMYSKADEILTRKAINYFKWYDNWPQPVRFRLKYTVYGFFWQHPENTILSSAVGQLKTLEDVYKSNPERMLQTKRPGIIVGDLNHFGGWFCQYCYQLIDIVKQLEDEKKIVKFSFNQIIDSSYIQDLISKGMYVDGKMGLIKIHRYADKYYMPEYVKNNSWKFDNIVMNLFSSWDDDTDGDYF